MNHSHTFLARQFSWFVLACLISFIGQSGCAEMSALISDVNTVESEQDDIASDASQPEPAQPPSIQEVEEAITSTKALLDEQQQQIGEVLSLRGEVQQTLRKFRDENLSPMHAAVETLQHQVGGWENTSAKQEETLSSTMEKMEQDLAQAETRVGVYGAQVTALVDQIDQNNRQYEKLLTEFQDSLVEFKGTMGEFTVTLATEKERASQEEEKLADQLGEQQQTLERVMPTAKEILDIQKRLNQLHGYINQVRDTVTSDTTALQAVLKNDAPEHLQDLIASLEQRNVHLSQTSSSNSSLTEQLQDLEQRIQQSEQQYAETVQALQEDVKQLSTERQTDADNSEKLETQVTSLEERYQALAQTSPSNPTHTANLEALEQRVEEAEQHYGESLTTLQEDMQKMSVEMQETSKTQELEKLQSIVASLEERYQGNKQVFVF